MTRLARYLAIPRGKETSWVVADGDTWCF